MATATKTKDVLDALEERRQKLDRSRAGARAAGEEAAQKRARAEALQNELNRLYLEQPELFDHLRCPRKPSSPAGKAAKELEALGADEAQAKYEHAKQIEQSAEQSFQDFAAAHVEEINEARLPDAEAAVDALKRADEARAAAVETYLGVAHQTEALRAAAAVRHRERHREYQHLRVVALDVGNELAAQRVQDLPLPTTIA